MSYEPTANEDIVMEVSSESIDLSVLVSEYLRLRTLYLGRPQPKTVPDQETLDFYNAFITTEIQSLISDIITLYYRIKPIYEVGLLPSKYDDEYTKLQTFVIANE